MTMLTLCLVALVAIVCIGFVAHFAERSIDRAVKRFDRDLELSEVRHREELDALTERHQGELLRFIDLAERHTKAVRDEREQWARLVLSRNAPDYGALLRTERTPIEAIAEADIHRAEALAQRRRTQDQYEGSLMHDGEPIVPVGMGG